MAQQIVKASMDEHVTIKVYTPELYQLLQSDNIRPVRWVDQRMAEDGSWGFDSFYGHHLSCEVPPRTPRLKLAVEECFFRPEAFDRALYACIVNQAPRFASVVAGHSETEVNDFWYH